MKIIENYFIISRYEIKNGIDAEIFKHVMEELKNHPDFNSDGEVVLMLRQVVREDDE